MKDAEYNPHENLKSVSCVIPTYNDGALLKEAILSVLKSSYPLLEIIVVDDGSRNDDAKNIVNSLDDKLNIPVVYIKKSNGGPSSARNVGLGIAQGEWIAFLDADDLMLPDSIKSKFKHYSDCKCISKVVGVYGSFIWSTTGLSQTFIKSFSPILKNHIGVMGKVPGGTPAYIFKKDALLNIGGFDESLKFNEDFDLLLRLIDFGYGLVGTDTPGFIRNVYEHSQTRKDGLKSLSGSRVFLRKAYRNRLLGRYELFRRFMINYLSTGKNIIKSFVGLKY